MRHGGCGCLCAEVGCRHLVRPRQRDRSAFERRENVIRRAPGIEDGAVIGKAEMPVRCDPNRQAVLRRPSLDAPELNIAPVHDPFERGCEIFHSVFAESHSLPRQNEAFAGASSHRENVEHSGLLHEQLARQVAES